MKFSPENVVVKNYRILLVEDNKEICEDFAKMFNLIFDLKTTDSAESALELLKSFEPEIIILDLMLSGPLDGISFLRILNSNINFKSIPVLILSGSDLEEHILLCLELGACDFMIKPQSFRVIRHKINAILSFKKGVIEEVTFSKNVIKNSQLNNIEDELVKKFSLLINHMIEDDQHITINEISKKLNVSSSYLQKVVKREYGLNPKSYLLNSRLEKANFFLKTKNIPIKTIAYSLGFNSTAYFTKCYKAKYGVSPRITKYQIENDVFKIEERYTTS